MNTFRPNPSVDFLTDNDFSNAMEKASAELGELRTMQSKSELLAPRVIMAKCVGSDATATGGAATSRKIMAQIDVSGLNIRIPVF